MSGSEEAVGFEAFHVADGRRSNTDYWTGNTMNAAQWVQAQCDRVRSANCIFLDRGHNLAGFPIQLQTSMDGVAWTNVLNLTLPTATVTNNATDLNYGVRTEEGAWWVIFPQTDGLYWRLFIPAMGANALPQVVGLVVGTAYQPQNFFNTPWGEDQDTFTAAEIVTPLGWRGKGTRAIPNAGQITLKLLTDDEYDLARYHLQGHYGSGRATLLCYDIAQADRAFIIARPNGPYGINFEPQWFPRQMRMNYLEHEPQETA